MEKSKASEMSMIGDVWTTDEPYRNLLTLCDGFGSRFAGTEGEKKPPISYQKTQGIRFI